MDPVCWCARMTEANFCGKDAAMSRRMLVVRNPRAGSFISQNTFLEAAGVIFKSDYNVYVYSTQCRGDATRIVAEEGANYDCIVAFGGDGTLNEVINGLMRLPERPVLGYIPAGTTNDFAAGLGLSKNPVKAAATVLEGETLELDVGQFCEERYFSYVASFGSFTKASYSAPQDAKNLLGYAAYLLEGLKSLSDIHPSHLRIQANGEEIEGDFIFGAVSNALSVGGMVKFDSAQVDLTDGLFEILMIRYPQNLADLQKILHDMATHHYGESDLILYLKAAEITVESDEPIPWTVDGEMGGTTASARVRNCHRAIRILKPEEDEHA